MNQAGSSSSVVTGKSGEEIAKDKYGRDKSQIHLDLAGQKTGKSKGISTANHSKTNIHKSIPSMKQAGNSAAAVTASKPSFNNALPSSGFAGTAGHNPVGGH